jgi:hypothetical protein
MEETEYPKDVTALLHPYLKQAVRTFQMLQVRLRHPLQFRYQVKWPDDLVLDLVPLFLEELLKIVLEENDGSDLSLACHGSKIGKLPESETF